MVDGFKRETTEYARSYLPVQPETDWLGTGASKGESL